MSREVRQTCPRASMRRCTFTDSIVLRDAPVDAARSRRPHVGHDLASLDLVRSCNEARGFGQAGSRRRGSGRHQASPLNHAIRLRRYAFRRKAWHDTGSARPARDLAMPELRDDAEPCPVLRTGRCLQHRPKVRQIPTASKDSIRPLPLGCDLRIPSRNHPITSTKAIKTRRSTG